MKYPCYLMSFLPELFAKAIIFRMILGWRDEQGSDLADGGQFGEEHLEDGWRQGLLQHLEELLRLTTHRYGIGQVVHSFLIVS